MCVHQHPWCMVTIDTSTDWWFAAVLDSTQVVLSRWPRHRRRRRTTRALVVLLCCRSCRAVGPSTRLPIFQDFLLARVCASVYCARGTRESNLQVHGTATCIFTIFTLFVNVMHKYAVARLFVWSYFRMTHFLCGGKE